MVLSGVVVSIRYRNESNGFTIAIVEVESEQVVCTGNIAHCVEGQSIRCEGSYTVHPKFGKQFKANRVEIEAPKSEDSIVKYLGSGLIKGIGPKTAMNIVSRFGKDTLDVIEFTPNRLLEVRGLSKLKVDELASSFMSVRYMQQAIIFLQSKGLGLKNAMKVFELYGKKTVSIITENPYKLIEDLDGIGFITADKIAKEVGISFDSDFRVRAGLIYVLRRSAEKEGNTFLPFDTSIVQTVQLLGLENDEKVKLLIDELTLDYKIKVFAVDDVKVIMSMTFFQTEKQIAVKLLALLREANVLNFSYEQDVREYENINKIKLHKNQVLAIADCFRHGVCVVTGGPGTGKTTIIHNILSVFKKNNLRVVLLAPTGRAAKRMYESTGQEASTIHRALMFGSLAYSNSPEILAADVVIVDEMSMVDIFLFRNLLNAIAVGTKLILLGDKDQLPSVGPGNVLRDILSSNCIPTVELSFIYRQGDKSLIAQNAHDINSGIMPKLHSKQADFFFVTENDSEQLANKVVDLVVKRLPKFLQIESQKIQVLCALKSGNNGIININKCIQEQLNPQLERLQIQTDDFVFRVGDKIMHTVNNYQLKWRRSVHSFSEKGQGVFNGDMGYISNIFDTGEMEVVFEDGRVSMYSVEDRLQLSLAYAITIHKSQGSEFEAIVMPVIYSSPMMMTRNLLYTAITRAKKTVVLCGSENAVKRMVDNNYIALRYSALNWFLNTLKAEKL
ncbi:MAG: ATP-dependent RecD-like DNA helicase [Clostridiales bacterium]|jgi:exodeoxyribonuclease V alpha subunit|nr:ATP-dependent RecD-like DNA helicase [Clostridiales bacterium]